jgi:hypothetical protein
MGSQEFPLRHKYQPHIGGYFVKRSSMKILMILPVFFVVGLILVNSFSGKSWRTASRESAGIAPDPSVTNEAVVHVYGADAWGWRGWFAIHTWIAAKRTNEAYYTVYDVVGWRSYRNQSVLRIAPDVPDRYWYGEKPRILKEHRGRGVDELIEAIDKAAHAYPWKSTYKAFPGPNSNTFTAWIAKQVPELELDLPFSAIGSGYVD